MQQPAFSLCDPKAYLDEKLCLGPTAFPWPWKSVWPARQVTCEIDATEYAAVVFWAHTSSPKITHPPFALYISILEISVLTIYFCYGNLLLANKAYRRRRISRSRGDKTEATMAQHQYIPDPNDFCRICKGSGIQSYESPTGANVTEPCDMCGGTGNRCVRLTKKVAA